MEKLLRRAMTVAAVGACLHGSVMAAQLADFKVNESVIPGSGAVSSSFTADKFTGPYVERFAVTSFNPLTNTGTFATAVYFNVASFSANDGTTLVAPTLLNNFEPSGYRLYATFFATGSFTATGGGGVDFTGASANFRLFADPDSNSGIGFDGGNVNNLGFTFSGATGDDRLLARSDSLLTGAGTFTPGQTAFGNFAILFGGIDGDGNVGDGLTTLGKSYFFEPDPFYAVVRTSGQFNTFTLPTVGNTTQFEGSVDVIFARDIPEPGSLALAGLALLGLAAGRRATRKTSV